MPVRALILDYKVLTHGDTTQIRSLLAWAHAQGLTWCLLSTQAMDPAQVCNSRGYPAPATCVHSANIPQRKGRGSPLWAHVAAQRLGVELHELLYLGGSVRDWRSAINAGVFYIHAQWTEPLPAGHNGYRARSPAQIRLLLEHFLLGEPVWAYQGSGENWEIRCLLPAGARLPCTSPRSEFTLQGLLTRKQEVKIGEADARDVLMLSVLANAYLEGLMATGALMCIYPSSTPGKVSDPLSGYFRPASHLFRGYYKEDLLVRARPAPDTSLERWRARNEGRPADVSVATQATTVHIGSSYAPDKLRGKTVIVVDDFTTQGMSLDWARTLLTTAGAARVILLAIGKYGEAPHNTYTPQTQFDPYSPTNLRATDFTRGTAPLSKDPRAQTHMQERITQLLPGSPPARRKHPCRERSSGIVRRRIARPSLPWRPARAFPLLGPGRHQIEKRTVLALHMMKSECLYGQSGARLPRIRRGSKSHARVGKQRMGFYHR